MMERIGPALMPQFAADRAALFTGGSVRRPGPEVSATVFFPAVEALDAQLAQQLFLLGAEPTLADFLCYHPIWFVLSNKGMAPRLEGYPQLMAWAARIQALGHGRPVECSAEEALAISCRATDYLAFDGALVSVPGVKLGDAVTVQATDYGCDPVAGHLLHASASELVIARSDPRAGTVHLHVPRQGFSATPA